MKGIKTLSLSLCVVLVFLSCQAQAEVVTETVWSADFTNGSNGGFTSSVSGSGSVDFSNDYMDIYDQSNTADVALAVRSWSFKGLGEADGDYKLKSYQIIFRGTDCNDVTFTGFMKCILANASGVSVQTIGMWAGVADALDFGSGWLTGNDIFNPINNYPYTYTITHDLDNDKARIEITHPTYADYDSGWITGVSDDVVTQIKMGTTLAFSPRTRNL